MICYATRSIYRTKYSCGVRAHIRIHICPASLSLRKAFHPPEPACVPLGSDRLAGAEVSRIVAELSSDEYLSAFFRGAKQAADLSMTPWRASKQSPGVLVRKATFLFPIPQDFPKAVTRLVSIPEATKVGAAPPLARRMNEA